MVNLKVYSSFNASILNIKAVLFYVLFVVYRSVYCLCVNVYCTTATG